MLTKRTRQILMASCIALTPAYALAQQPSSQQSPSAAQSQSQTALHQSSGAMKALAAPEPGQMMGSDLRGTNIYTANNENVGDIDDLLIDKQGKVVAVIVGVGGFLGMGQKNVAIPFEALEIIEKASASASRSGSATSDRLVTGTAPGETSAERQQGAARTTQPPRAAQVGVLHPERIVLRGMTKAELEAAPAFHKDGSSARSGSSSGNR